MGDDYVATVRIRRPARVSTDGGRNVWSDTIEEVELELVSTSELESLLKSGDNDTRGAIRKALSGQEEGVLARDPSTGLFQVVSEAELKSFFEEKEDAPIRRRPTDIEPEPRGEAKEKESEELSLVSTQMLRRIIPAADKPTRPPAGPKPKAKKDRSGGFDPYNSD
jgi:hypothetical protein